MEAQQTVILSLLAALLVVSAFRVVHPAALALLGALGVAVWLGPSAALTGVRPDVLLTSAGVMVLAGYFKRSGIVAWLALKAAKNARGKPAGILVRLSLMAFTAGALFGPAADAFVLPVALLLAVELDVPILPFVVTLYWCSFLGGTALLTAQPGNLWVGAALGIDSGHWLAAMLPVAAALMVTTLIVALVAFRRSLRVTNERRARVLEYDARKALENKPLAMKTVIVTVLVILGVALIPVRYAQPAVIVLAGALLLTLLADRSSAATSLSEIDGASLLWYGAVLSVSGALADWTLTHLPHPLALLGAVSVAATLVDPGALAGIVASTVRGSAPGLLPLIVAGSAVGGAVTLWSARTNTLNAAVKGNRGPGWGRVTLWGALFAVINLALLGVLWLVVK